MLSHSEQMSLSVEVPADGSCPAPKEGKVPRKILHFSDGTLEEYSTDEEDGIEPKTMQANVQNLSNVDPKSLAWMPWFWYHTVVAGSKTLDACDYLGESLANFFGITTPKYQFEIDHFQQMAAEEESLKKEQDLEMGGWVSQSNNADDEGRVSVTKPITSQRRESIRRITSSSQLNDTSYELLLQS